MTDRETVTEYRYHVLAIHSLLSCIEWNQRHGLPVLTLQDQLPELRRAVVRFEDVLAAIPDLRTQNIIRCRFALGWNEYDTAEFLEMSRGAVQRIASDTLQRLH